MKRLTSIRTKRGTYIEMEHNAMSLDSIVADKQLDTSGLSCPMPLLKTKKTLASMNPGEILEVLSSDPGSQKDIPRFGDKGGNTFLGVVTDEDGTFRYYIKKG